MEKQEIRYHKYNTKNADVLFIAYGISFRIAQEAARILEEEKIKVGFFRPISLWPYPYHSLEREAKGKRAVFVFELSSGQMLEDVRIALKDKIPLYFYGRMGGGVFDGEELAAFVKKKLKTNKP